MPAMGPIAINDGKTTPVVHTFAPVRTDGSSGKLANRSASIPQGFETLEVTVREPQSATGSYRLDFSMTLPSVAAVDGQDQVVRRSKATLTLNLSPLSSAQDRKDIRILLKNMLDNTLVTQVIENVEPLY